MLSSSTSAPIQSHHTRPSVNPLYSKCKILKFADNIKLSNFLFAHDSIKSNLPTSFCDSITINIPILQKSRSKSGKYSCVRTKTSGSNSIKSKSANIWKFLQIFINRLFYNGLCLMVHPIFYYLFVPFLCLISVVLLVLVSMYLMVLSCIFLGQVWAHYMLTDCIPSNCKNQYF